MTQPLPANVPYIKVGQKQTNMAQTQYYGQQNNVNYNYKTVKCRNFDQGMFLVPQAHASSELSAFSLMAIRT
jgi:hypothetical protein